MSVTAEVQIMNSALVKMGAERISSPDDNNSRALLMREQYPKLRDQLLRSHPWKFATKRTQLGVISPKPDGYLEWSYVFQLPSDNLRILNLVNVSPYECWDTEGTDYLLTNLSEITIRHLYRVTDVTKYDDNFCEVLAWGLACDTAFAVTGKKDLVASLQVIYQKHLAEARSFNAQQGSVQRVQAEALINSRRY
jgi:hypothetical protein